MTLYGRLSGVWFQSTVAAWWDAWLDFWGFLSSRFDKREMARERALERDLLDADLISSGGGNFDAAGTGGQD